MLARTTLRGALTRLHEGRLTIIDGGRRTDYGPGGAPTVTVTVHDPRLWGRTVRKGSIGLGDAYANGWFDTDDLAALIRLLSLNLEPIWRHRDRIANALGPFRDRRPSASRGAAADRRFIAAHYDLSNEFFASMLDDTMAYSCALFEQPGTSLARAQEAKFEALFDRLELSSDDHLLEIGTGWGGLAVHAARTRGCRVTTTTISAEQHAFARSRVAAAGLEDLVQVLDLDYRAVRGSFDKIVSVEMVEAVDWRDHQRFFDALAGLVRPGGRVVLQAIVIDDRSYEGAKRRDNFIKARIFPGGCLPSVGSIERSTNSTGLLSLTATERIGDHYPETLRRWRANLERNRDAVAGLGFDERFRRLWDFYLQYCIGAFEAGHIDVIHATLDRHGDSDGPIPHDNRILVEV